MFLVAVSEQDACMLHQVVEGQRPGGVTENPGVRPNDLRLPHTQSIRRPLAQAAALCVCPDHRLPVGNGLSVLLRSCALHSCFVFRCFVAFLTRRWVRTASGWCVVPRTTSCVGGQTTVVCLQPLVVYHSSCQLRTHEQKPSPLIRKEQLFVL